MTVKARTRACSNCGEVFRESRSDSNAQWEKREFCSINCNNSSPHRVTSIFDRLERHQVKQEGCWGWTGAIDDKGYGVISSREKSRSPSPEKAHRVSYEKEFGSVPDGMNVCHKCDNPPCTNPEHLFAGTQKDNMVDCSIKGRLNKASLRNLRPGMIGVLGAAPKKEAQ
ncbi:HNH endonuclease signature motif containing protein [Stutzerimonas nitrititolerans]|uniref:HNH endonuclease signature motif containing protein n=1 Tax=Stutzerimonas nitrititolerans TaxID=2482751 RepID=UPI0028A8855B|nr:HNH endonuclease signature motif containing protein [Stutzerimonas nitrititolerans]